MNPRIERRSTLRKAPVTDDLVAGLTEPGRSTAPEPAPAPKARPPRTKRTAAPKEAAAPPRRGPGRPRGRRRMEPFSTKIEITLRDEIDAYTAQYGESLVDLIDRALRAAITEPPPEH